MYVYLIVADDELRDGKKDCCEHFLLTGDDTYVVVVFNSVMISVSFNGIQVVYNMFCLEL
jgi:hypothetical protein